MTAPTLALIGGAFTAFGLIGHPIGAGSLVLAALITSAGLVHEGERSAHQVVFTGLAAGLVIPSVFVAAPWVSGGCLLFAASVLAFALAEPAGFLETTKALLSPARWIPGARFVARPVVTSIGDRGWTRLFPLLRGMSVGMLAVVIFGALFASADRAFAQMTDDLLIPSIDLTTWPLRAIAFLAVVGTTGAIATSRGGLASGDRGIWVRPLGEREIPRSALSRIEWVLPLVLIDALFASFFVVQLAVLYGDHSHVIDTVGLTYSEYARQGFFELLGVSILTLMSVFAFSWWVRPASDQDRRLLKVLLGTLCVLTLAVITSALKRLGLYEEAYGFTIDRWMAHAMILWIAALFLVIIGAGLKRSTPWLPRALVAATAISAIVAALANPEAQVARNNVARYERTGKIDLGYLAMLGPDAAPAMAQLEEPLRSCALRSIADRFRPDPSWFAANLARSEARSILETISREGESCSPRL